jgi:DNA-binding CsgD family transcriptional regulator/tetratricopeptide (TPR) repeat protein
MFTSLASRRPYDQTVLIGRKDEQGRIEGLIADVRARRGGALVVRGEAGVGKTALLEHAAGTASDFRILRATGIQSEAELAFATLHALLHPLTAELESLPRPQADALRRDLALGPSAPGDAFATFAGVLGLLVAAADRQPVLVLLDDAHLVDRSSAQALGFAVRRLRDEPVGVLLAVRDGEPSTFDTEGLPELVVTALDDDDARELLSRVVPAASAEGLHRILGLARGNPLALLELPALVGLDEPTGDALHEPPRTSVLLSRVFGRRMEGLPEATRTALVVSAASDDDRLNLILRACGVLGIDALALDPAEAAGVVRVDGERLEFRHPLVRAVAYSDATPAVRRDAHRALAEALVDRRTEERWAWHRALAAVGPDEVAAGALELVGRRSMGRSASAAARAFEQAARLSVRDDDRARRLLEAARAAEEAGRLEVSVALAEEAGRLRTNDLETAEIAYALGRATARLGDGGDGVEILAGAAERARAIDPERAALMLADAADAAIDTDPPRAESLARSAWQIPWPKGGLTEQLVTLRYADVLGRRGDARQATQLWLRAGRLVDPEDPERLRLAGEALFSAGDDAGAVEVLQRAVDLARRRSALNVLTQSLEFIALAEARRGRLQSALDAAAEELDLLSALRQPREELYACSVIAWIEAALGREADCRAHVARAVDLGRRLGRPLRTGAALGVLELALGHAAAAAAELERRAPGSGSWVEVDAISTRPMAPALVEALVRVSRSPEAEPLVPPFEAVAVASGRPLLLGLARRMRGLVEGSTEQLESSVATLAAAANRYEQARSELLLGEARRRERQRGAARVALRSAIAGFESVGAATWAERARSELAVTGETARRRGPSALGELTPQERNVARLVARGLSNRQIAEQLFLSPNTIETHLRHIFQKTGVTSRTQLALAFAAND